MRVAGRAREGGGGGREAAVRRGKAEEGATRGNQLGEASLSEARHRTQQHQHSNIPHAVHTGGLARCYSYPSHHTSSQHTPSQVDTGFSHPIHSPLSQRSTQCLMFDTPSTVVPTCSMRKTSLSTSEGLPWSLSDPGRPTTMGPARPALVSRMSCTVC